jgi:hypothetical protein
MCRQKIISKYLIECIFMKICGKWITIEGYVSRLCEDDVKIRSQNKFQNHKINVGQLSCGKKHKFT